MALGAMVFAAPGIGPGGVEVAQHGQTETPAALFGRRRQGALSSQLALPVGARRCQRGRLRQRAGLLVVDGCRGGVDEVLDAGP